MPIMLLPIEGIPAVIPGDDLAALIGDAIDRSRLGLKDGDVVVVCQKVVSKAEGRIVKLADVVPSERAREFAEAYDKDPAVVEVALAEATEVLRMGDGHLITATGPGFVCANSGLDRSNAGADGTVTLLPEDADRSAAALLGGLQARFQKRLAVIVTDTFGRPWRMGQVDVAIGAAGMNVLDDHEGRSDWTGRPLEHTALAVADQLSAAAGLLMGKSAGVPVVLVRGHRLEAGAAKAADLVRPRENDLFR